MKIGIVEWRNEEKNCAGIKTLQDGNFFLYDPKNLHLFQKGVAVNFEAFFDEKMKRPTAKNPSLLISTIAWYEAMNYLSAPHGITIEGKKYDLVRIATLQLFSNRKEGAILNSITHYYEKILDKNLFIDYCNLLSSVQAEYNLGDAGQALKKAYIYFDENKNEEVLFQVWKSKKFIYINQIDCEDYEIPQHLLSDNLTEDGILTNLDRISKYSYGEDFIKQHFIPKLATIEITDSNAVNGIYKQVKNTENDMLMAIIDELMYKKTNAFLEDKYVEIGEISKLDTLNEYKNLKKWINTNLSEKYTEVLSSNINTAIENNAVGNYKTILWASGWNIEVSPTEIQNTFLSDITSATRCNILKKLPFDTQTELIKIYFERFRYKGIFDLLHQYLTAINKTVSISFKSNYLNTAYWDDKEGKDLLVFVQNYLAIHCTEQENFDLFFDDFSDVLSKNLAIQNLETLSNSKLEKVLKHKDCDAILAFDLLLKKVYTAKYTDYETVLNWAKTYLEDTQKTKINDYIFNLLCEKIAQPDVNYRSVLNLCKAHFSDSQCYKIDVFISETCDANEYLRLWEDGVGKIIPKKQILALLNDDTKIYEKLQRWIVKELLTTEEVTDMMLDELAKDTPVTDRMIFYRFYNAIRFLSALNSNTISRINSLNNDFYTVILWFLDYSAAFDFDILKQKFIYFNPEDQVVIVRKLFGLIHKKELNIGIEKLNELTRIDLDLYRTNLQFNPQIPLDISTDVVLKALLSYKETGRFLVDSDLLTVVLANLYDRNVNNTQTKVYNKEQEFKLETYFEACEGRLAPKYNFDDLGGYITKKDYKKPSGESTFYFAIHLYREKEKRQWNSQKHDYDDVFVENHRFEEQKAAIKKITGSEWKQEKQHWVILAQHEQEVLAFAEEYRLGCNFTPNKFKDNPHLVEYNREEKPTVFCEGRKANNIHNEYKREFWWCKNAACFENCQTFHTAEEWKSYTMLDFVTILGFDTDEINTVGDFVSYGKYYHFVGLINRFNRLLERLYCEDCYEMLYPTATSHFGRYSTLRFQCQNECCQNREIIYLNDCFNWQCKNIIDSRISRRCNYDDNAMIGLYICDECGGCCSHRKLNEKLNNLTLVGGYIPPDLPYKVEHRLGHLERAEYFCYKCATPMREFQIDHFKCDTVGCDVRYDTTKYNIERPHRHLVEKKKEE